MTWQFVDTGPRRGAFNMEYDEFLAQRMVEGEGNPTVRVYGWDPFAISLGYHQSETEIDVDRCRKDGVDVVRRPTGGRAIFHARELTYGVVMPTDGKSVSETYEYISRALLAALSILGIKADVADGNVSLLEFYKSDLAVLCFASASRSEIQYEGKKIIGSAQRRYVSPGDRRRTVLLQHGSLLLGRDHRRLAEYVRLTNAASLDNLNRVLDAKTTEVETILGRTVSFDEAADAVRKGFETAWGIRFADKKKTMDHDSIIAANIATSTH
jgi:lipoate-protein ligase A